jgi:hypothetical protein
LAIAKLELTSAQQERQATLNEQKGLNVTGLAEQRRIKDLKAKLERKLADCDLLILPRMTLYNVNNPRENLPEFIYKLDRAQVDAIRDFLRRGKPVLALFGPTNQPGGMPADFMHGGADEMEPMLGELGIRLGKETILFNSELKSFAERRMGFVFVGARVEVPPITFEWKPGGRPGMASALPNKGLKPNPIAESMLLTVAGVDEKQNLDLRLRHPRPVYYQPGLGNQHPGTEAVFMMSDPRGWKEAQPFPSGGKTPRPNLQDSGQFPIGVAVEAALPKDWKTAPDKGAQADHVRVAAIGHGGVFIGSQLSPVREKLLLDTCNWLLGRDDMLAHKKTRWEFPRVGLSPESNELWQWGARLGIPAFFVLLGIAVLLKRSLR